MISLRNSSTVWESPDFTYPSGLSSCSFSDVIVNHNQGKRAKILNMFQPNDDTHCPDFHFSGSGACLNWTVFVSNLNSITFRCYNGNFIAEGVDTRVAVIF